MPTYEQIAARAREIYLKNGCKAGYDVDNWLQAEYELMHVPVRELAKLTPPQPSKGKPKRTSVVELVRAAML